MRLISLFLLSVLTSISLVRGGLRQLQESPETTDEVVIQNVEKENAEEHTEILAAEAAVEQTSPITENLDNEYLDSIAKGESKNNIPELQDIDSLTNTGTSYEDIYNAYIQAMTTPGQDNLDAFPSVPPYQIPNGYKTIVGGYGEEIPMDDEVRMMVYTLRPQIQASTGENYFIYVPVSYKIQEVAGTNYKVRIAVNGERSLYVVINKALLIYGGGITLTEVVVIYEDIGNNANKGCTGNNFSQMNYNPNYDYGSFIDEYTYSGSNEAAENMDYTDSDYPYDLSSSESLYEEEYPDESEDYANDDSGED